MDILRTQLGVDVVDHVSLNVDDPFSFGELPNAIAERIVEPIETARDRYVERYGEDWTDHFSLYLSANSGTTPIRMGVAAALQRMHALQVYVQGVRRQIDRRLNNATVISLDVAKQIPRVKRGDISNKPVRHAIEEMEAWRNDFLRLRPHRPGDEKIKNDGEYRFWFRKGNKEVLAIIVANIDGERKSFRGVNIEVSLPTGTLCAERNAIGSAFAQHPNLERGDIEAVAVLGLSGSPTLGPCGACMEWLRKVAEINPRARIVTFPANERGEANLDEAFIEQIV